jgi:hypothetical protein
VRLISDNRILAVPSAVITRPESGETEELEETVVSTFGVLAGDGFTDGAVMAFGNQADRHCHRPKPDFL